MTKLAPTTDAADYNVKVTVRNGRLLARIRAAGYPSVSAFAKANAIHQSVVQKLVSLAESGMTKKQIWRNAVIQIADILQCMPHDIVPPQHWHDPLDTRTFELALTGEQAAELVGSNDQPDANLIRQELTEQLLTAMQKHLTPREERVVRLRYGIDCEEHTLEQIGQQYGVSRDRIMQIENKAIRKLRKPSRAKKLEPYLNDPAVTK